MVNGEPLRNGSPFSILHSSMPTLNRPAITSSYAFLIFIDIP
jgi:hypothetical protein